MQRVNTEMQKTVQAGMKHELGKARGEKEYLEDKLKSTIEKLRNKTLEVQELMRHPIKSEDMAEAAEEMRQKRIEELETDLLE